MGDLWGVNREGALVSNGQSHGGALVGVGVGGQVKWSHFHGR